MPYLKRINSLPLINHISYKYAQVSDIGPSWSSCSSFHSSVWQQNQSWSYSLPNGKISDWSKLKAFAEDKINVTEKLKVVLRRVENIVGKGENAVTSIFSFFHNVFKRLLLRVGIML